LHNYWAHGHILTKSNELFDFFYADFLKEKINMFLGFSGNELTGLQGFIPSDHFFGLTEKKINNNFTSIIWLSLWHVNKNAPNGQGIRLLREIEKNFSSSILVATGYRDSVEVIYKSLGFETGILDHYVVINPEIEKTKLKPFDLPKSTSINRANLKLVKIKKVSDRLEITNIIEKLSLENLEITHFKIPFYYLSRFINFKFYEYEFYVILGLDQNTEGFMICRISNSPLGKVLRIVEIITKSFLINLHEEIVDILVKNNFIYADYYDNLEEKEFSTAFGFLRLKEQNSIPNLFEPFSIKRKIFRVAIKGKRHDTNLYITRADGDQDRPSILL
jgi:hypothetical protein